jgi:hypothetical protein
MRKSAFLLMLFCITIFINSCADGIVSECPDETPPTVSANFSSIQSGVFDKHCATAGCHAAINPQSGLDLSSGNSYNNIVNKEVFGRIYINPGRPDNSYLFNKMNSNTASVVMPPTGRLPQPVLDSIRLWIQNGALNN